MKLGLSTALTSPRRGGASVYDPASLALTGWWREFTSTWSGTASAGSSGGETLNTANPPSAGSLNGYATANFNGTANNMVSSAGHTIDTFFNASTLSLVVLFKGDSAGPADAGASGRYAGRTLLSDSAGSGYLHAGHNASGAYVSIYNGSYKSALAACDPTHWTRLSARLTGGTLSVRANGGAWSTAAIASIDAMTGVLTLGIGYSASAYDGQIADLLLIDQALSDDDFADVESYLAARYGL